MGTRLIPPRDPGPSVDSSALHAVAPDEDQAQWRCEEPLHEVAGQAPTPLPKLQLSVLLYVQLAEPITFTVILPFIVKLVEETGITGGDFSKVGYYAGLVESLFFLIEALMILQWGRISDKIGRRPVLLIGLFGIGISMLCFGLSRTFWAVVASRALAGALNGNSGIFKCMMSEITDETNVAEGFAFMPIMWALGNTIGPLIGGLLQHPYERFGGVFEYTFWKNNPYFLPCLVAASYSTSAFVLAYCLLKETAPSIIAHKSSKDFTVKRYDGLDDNLVDSHPPLTVESTERSHLVPGKASTISLGALLTPRVIVVILNYGCIALLDMAFIAIQPLFLSLPIENGGLGMSPSVIGICLASFGIANGTICVLFFGPLDRRFGTRNVFAACVTAYIGCFALWPVMNALARSEGSLGIKVWVVLIIQLTLATLTPMSFGCIFVFLSSAAPRATMGATTGIAQSTASIMRAIAPAGASSLFALSMEHNLLGGSLVYVVLCALTVCTVAASTLLPARPWRRTED